LFHADLHLKKLHVGVSKLFKKIYLRRKPPIREVAVTMENRLLFVYYAIAKKTYTVFCNAYYL